MYYGSCLCGSVKIQISGGISSIVHCHCSLCRKSSGTAFATNGFVKRADFRIVSGESDISIYEFKPGKYRHFCRNCGSPVYSSSSVDTGRVRVRMGALDSDIVERPISHNFVTSKANWEDLDAKLPRYEGFEPGRS